MFGGRPADPPGPGTAPRASGEPSLRGSGGVGQIIAPVSFGASKSGGRSSGATGRFTVRRLRSAFFLFRSSIRGADVLVAGVFAALSLGLGAYLFARAQAAAHLSFTQHAQRLQAAVNQMLETPQEDLATLSSVFEASGRVTRRQFHLLTDPMLMRHRLIYALEWLPFVRDVERTYHEAEARAAGLAQYRFWEAGPDGAPREAGVADVSTFPIHFMEPPNVLALGFDISCDPTRLADGREGARLGDHRGLASVRPDRGDRASRTPRPPSSLYAPVYNEGEPATVPNARAASRSRASPWRSFASRPWWTSAASAIGRVAASRSSLRDAEAPARAVPRRAAERRVTIAAAAAMDTRPFPSVISPAVSWLLDVFGSAGALSSGQPRADRGRLRRRARGRSLRPRPR